MAQSWIHLDALTADHHPGDALELSREESQHLLARRQARHEPVTLFNGVDALALARLVETPGGKKSARVQIVEMLPMPSAPAPSIHLGFALPKGDRLSTLLDMTTQIGVDQLTPLRFERSIVEPTEKPGKQERLNRILIEACKQSRRPRLPQLHEGQSCLEFATIQGAASAGVAILLADPEGDPITTLRDRVNHARELRLIVGPEGGVSLEERSALIALGAQPVSLGPWIQRIETAAISAVSLASGWAAGWETETSPA